MKHRSINAVVLEFIDTAFDKVSWHGPNLANSFRGLDAKSAAKRLPGRKSIWEQVLHTAYWKRIVLNKLVGTENFPRRGSNWPKLPDKLTDRAWREDQKLLHDIHGQLRGAIEKLDWDALDARVKRMVQGIAFHDIYHAGQIRLLRKMMGKGRKSKSQ